MPRITDGQMESLKRCVSLSPDASEDTKRILLWMLSHTDMLSIPVELTFPPEHEALGRQAVDDVHWMVSNSRQTRIQEFITRFLELEYPDGRMYSRSTTNGGQWKGWLYIGGSGHKRLTFNIEEIEKTRLLC
jgi:hypothetical protein